MPVDASLRAELAAAHVLTPFGVEFRYPGQEVADVATARRAIREAERVPEAVLARLRPYLERGRP